MILLQAEQHFLKHNDAGSWIQDSALMLSMCKEVPWYLVGMTSLLSSYLNNLAGRIDEIFKKFVVLKFMHFLIVFYLCIRMMAQAVLL